MRLFNPDQPHIVVVVSSDTMIRTDEQLHARYSPYVQEIAWREIIAPAQVPHEHQASVLDWVNDHHLNFLHIFGLARGCLAPVAV